MGEITVKIGELEAAEQKLDNLIRNTESRRIRLSVSKSSGDIVTQLEESARRLNDLTDALQSVFVRTQEVIRNTRIAFSEADKRVAESLQEQQ